MTDLVVLSLEAWDDVWRRNQHLVAGLLRSTPGMRVLFVEPPADPLHTLRRHHVPHQGHGLRRGPELAGVHRDALWLYQPTKYLPRRVDPHLDARTAERIEHTADRLGFTAPLLWVNDPTGAHVLSRTDWPALYDVTDDWLAADRPPAEHDRLVRNEAVLLEECREIVVCSPALQRTKVGRGPTTLVRNAVEPTTYRIPRPRPADLPEGPVAAYVGTIHTDRVDLDLCVETARGLAGEGSLVLVGPAPLEPADLSRLTRAGVVVTGPRPREAVPAYLQHADVLLVPHVVTAFTDSLDPIKVYEYAAVGRPVVSTPVAGFRDVEGDRVRIAVGSDFVEAVRERIPATSRFPQGADTPVPSWSDRVAQMTEVLARLKRAAHP